ATMAGKSLDLATGKDFRNLNKEIATSTAAFTTMGNRATSSLKAINKDTASLARGFQSLKNIVLTTATAIASLSGITGLTRAADAMIGFNNRLKLTEET